jgi:hypothetical protein
MDVDEPVSAAFRGLRPAHGWAAEEPWHVSEATALQCWSDMIGVTHPELSAWARAAIAQQRQQQQQALAHGVKRLIEEKAPIRSESGSVKIGQAWAGEFGLSMHEQAPTAIKRSRRSPNSES